MKRLPLNIAQLKNKSEVWWGWLMFGGKDKTKPTFLLPILDSLAEPCKLIDNKKINKENKKTNLLTHVSCILCGRIQWLVTPRGG